MNWTVTIPAETIDELHHKLAKMIDTAALEAELEMRVRVIAPAEQTTTTKPAKPAKPAKVETKKEVKKPAPAPEPVEPEQTSDDDFDTDEDGPTAEEYTIEAVKDALNEFKVKHGLVTARQIMVDAGGSSKLIDIPPANYGKLIAALNEHAAG
jgi:hypothetical protein